MPCIKIVRSMLRYPKKDAGRRTFKEEDALPHESSYIMHSALAVEAPSCFGTRLLRSSLPLIAMEC